MRVDATAAFKADFSKLSNETKKAVEKQIVQLIFNHNHPSLRLEGIKGFKGLYSVRVNKRFRISLSFEGDNTIHLRRVLDHDDLYASP